jgi:hypothetical protein
MRQLFDSLLGSSFLLVAVIALAGMPAIHLVRLPGDGF